MRRYLRYFTLLLLSCFGTACSGQTIKVRLISVANGAPIPNQELLLLPLQEKLKSTGKNFQLATASNGEAQFDLPDPAPPRYEVRAYLNGSRWFCNCVVLVSTEEVLQKGFVVPAPSDQPTHTNPPSPKPGEILLIARPTPWWVRVLYPLIKE